MLDVKRARRGVGKRGLVNHVSKQSQLPLFYFGNIPFFVVDSEVLRQISGKTRSWRRAANSLQAEVVWLGPLYMVSNIKVTRPKRVSRRHVLVR